jgi:hypothetical protein
VNDGTFEIYVTANYNGGQAPNLVFSFTDSNNYLLVALFSNQILLQSNIAGVNAGLATVGFTLVNAQTYRITATRLGQAITVYIDGVVKATFTLTSSDAAALPGTRAGMRCGGTASGQLFDNFTVNP